MSAQHYQSPVSSHCFRLRPGQDLKKEIQYYCQTHHIHAASVLTSVGSLKKAHLRLANGKESVEFMGPFEIIALNGTTGIAGIHTHISIANTQGHVLGGHLMDGCEVYTTAEIILIEHNDLIFDRQLDGHTGYKELKINQR